MKIALVERHSYLTYKVTNDEWLHNSKLSNYQDTNSYENINFIEVVQELGIKMEEHPKCEYNMLELIKYVEYIDFIGIDEIFLFLYFFNFYFEGITSW